MILFFKLGYPKFILDKAFFQARRSFYHTSYRQPFSPSGKLFLPYIAPLDSSFNKNFLRSQNTGIVYKFPNSIKSNIVSHSPKQVYTSSVYKICNNCNFLIILW